MNTNANVKKNVMYSLTHGAVFSRLALKEKASLLGVDASSVQRWMSGETTPRPAKRALMADLLGLQDGAVFELPGSQFAVSISNARSATVDYTRIQQRFSSGSIEKWKHLWGEVACRLAGSYILYTRVLTDAEAVAQSLLRIVKKTEHGILFDIANVEDRNMADRPTIYTYRGMMFPIYDCLIFHAEEKSLDEPLSMITTSSQVQSPKFLTGYLIAVGVSPRNRIPTGTKVVLSFQHSKLLDVGKLGRQLGVKARSELDKRVEALLFD